MLFDTLFESLGRAHQLRHAPPASRLLSIDDIAAQRTDFTVPTPRVHKARRDNWKAAQLMAAVFGIDLSFCQTENANGAHNGEAPRSS